MATPVAETDRSRYNYDRVFTRSHPPQGMTAEQFRTVAIQLRERLRQESDRTGDLGDDLFVHGSRARRDADVDADLDIGIRVSAERFEQLLQERLARVQSGSDRADTLEQARERGRLHAAEAGISGVRKGIQRLVNDAMGLGFTRGVQLTVIREAGPFDLGPFPPLPTGDS